MCDATNFRVGRMDELRCALRLPPRRALRFSIPIAAIERDENWQIHDFTLFLLRLFYDPPNFLKKRDAPNRVPTTSRRSFQNSKEMRVLPCGKADRDRTFRKAAAYTRLPSKMTAPATTENSEQNFLHFSRKYGNSIKFMKFSRIPRFRTCQNIKSFLGNT